MLTMWQTFCPASMHRQAELQLAAAVVAPHSNACCDLACHAWSCNGWLWLRNAEAMQKHIRRMGSNSKAHLWTSRAVYILLQGSPSSLIMARSRPSVMELCRTCSKILKDPEIAFQDTSTIRALGWSRSLLHCPVRWWWRQ